MNDSTSENQLENKDRIELLIARAMNLLRLTKADFNKNENKTLARHARELYLSNQNDSVAAEAALYSAIIDLDSLGLANSQQNTIQGNSEILVLELIRVAYNRAQKKRRKDSRIQIEARRGETVPFENAPRNLDQICVSRDEFHAQFSDLLNGMYGDLDCRETEILNLLMQGHTQLEVANQLGIGSRSTISRIISSLGHRIRRLLDSK